jgi:hypothetical protein
MGLNALLDQQDACTKIRTKITAEFPAAIKSFLIFCIFTTQRILANSDTSILMNHQIPEPYVTPEEAADFFANKSLKSHPDGPLWFVAGSSARLNEAAAMAFQTFRA